MFLYWLTRDDVQQLTNMGDETESFELSIQINSPGKN